MKQKDTQISQTAIITGMMERNNVAAIIGIIVMITVVISSCSYI